MYKYLVMCVNGDNGIFLKDLDGGGGRYTAVDTHCTHFRSHDFGGGHENDDYWNTPDELIVGFCGWYSRMEEKEAYHMGNRIYAACAEYRFFRVDEDFIAAANVNLQEYEITEQCFIKDMVKSYAFKRVQSMFQLKKFNNYERSKQKPTNVEVIYNQLHDTWSWTSDYLDIPNDHWLVRKTLQVPVGLDYDKAVKHITEFLNVPYRFGGNDKYNEEKDDGKPNK